MFVSFCFLFYFYFFLLSPAVTADQYTWVNSLDDV